MGAWGLGPFENDGAADLIANLSKHIDKVVAYKNTERGNRSARYHYQEARAAAAILLASHGTDILGGPSLEPALQALLRMRADEGWIGAWRDPRDICKALDKEIRALRRKIKTCCEAEKTAKAKARAMRRNRRKL